ncbi:MAG: DUF2064 domain-containing protein [Planctomycetes bacterium]|nr:DUF2064 domain-containing protein [Planctomycetota bacterium]
MAKTSRDSGPRPAALIVAREPWLPPEGGQELATALREDVGELLGSLRLRIEPAPNATAADIVRIFQREKRPLLLAFSDVPALPALSVEGALEELVENAVVVGPCADGAVYLLGMAPGLDDDIVGQLAEAACGPAHDALGAVTDAVDVEDLPVVLLPPWTRIGSDKDLSFAENLARLSLMSEDGEEDFLADRLRLWFERHAT